MKGAKKYEHFMDSFDKEKLMETITSQTEMGIKRILICVGRQEMEEKLHQTKICIRGRLEGAHSFCSILFTQNLILKYDAKKGDTKSVIGEELQSL